MNLKGKLAIAGQPIGSGGASSWDDLTGKPFSTVDTESGLTIQDDTLMIDTLDHIATIDYVDHQIAEVSDPSWNDIQDKPTFATVATSGDYEDLSNKPTIPTVPTNVSDFTNDAGYITSSDLSGYATESYVDSAVEHVDWDTIHNKPENLSDFNNDEGFITSSDLPQADGTSIIDNNGIWSAAGGGDWNARTGQTGYIANKPEIIVGNGVGSIIEGHLANGITNTANGYNSHAEGGFNHANGTYSHVEGVSNIASQNQHVQGLYAFVDDATIPFYADMVGNGHSSPNDPDNENPIRQNAEATDWDGNKYLAGDVYIGVTDWSDPQNNSTKLTPGSVVGITNTLSTGTAIADIDIDGVTTTLYAPQGGGGSSTQADWAETDTTANSYIQNKPAVYAGTDNGVAIGTNFSQATRNALVIGKKSTVAYLGAWDNAISIGDAEQASSALYDNVEASNGSIATKGKTSSNAYGKNTRVKADNASLAMAVSTYRGDITASEGSIAFGQAGTAASSSQATALRADRTSFAGGKATYNSSRHGVYAGYNPETGTTNGIAFAFGENVRAYQKGSVALGQSVEAQSPSQTAVGSFNVIDNASTYNFIVGNGTAHASRSNSFAAGTDGNTYIKGDIYTNVSDWSNPTTSGTKLANIPAPPTTDGTYTLQAAVSDGTITYNWI